MAPITIIAVMMNHIRTKKYQSVHEAAPELQEEAAKVLAQALDKHEDKVFRKSGAEGLGYLGEAAM
ncbi:TY5A, partial [Symbiodinium sp. CCMP2456]